MASIKWVRPILWILANSFCFRVRASRSRFKAGSAPAFEDFDEAFSSDSIGNRSLLFIRQGNSWHGVKPIQCPEGHLRKVFIVVIDNDKPWYRLRSRLKI